MEKILKEIKENFSIKKNNYKRGGFDVDETKKHIRFYGGTKEEILAMEELQPLFNYMKEKGYTSNLKS